MAAAVTHLVSTPDTGNLPNTSGGFTPSAGDLIVVFVTVEGATADKALTSSVGSALTFTQVRKQTFRSGVDTLYCYVSDQLVTDTTAGQTVATASGGSGSIISVYRIAGLNHFYPQALVQVNGKSDQASGAPAPNPAFAAAAQTFNAVMGAVANSTNPAGMTPPSGWTETAAADTGYATGAVTGLESCFRNSGETGTTITWGSNSASISASIILELAFAIVNTETGAGIIGMSGGGVSEVVSPHTPTTYTKTGHATLGIDAHGNAGELGFVGTGADVSAFSETGVGIRGFVGSGASQKVTGAGVYSKAGSGIAGFVGAAVDVWIFARAGAGIRGQVGSGVDAWTLNRAGSGIRGHVGAGSDESSRTESGTGIAGFSASGADVSSFVETGVGIRGHVGSGTSQKVSPSGTIYAKSGKAILGTSLLDSRRGTGILGFSGTGTNANVFVENGAGIGGNIDFIPEAGGARLGLVGSAVDTWVFGRSGTGIRGQVGSGSSERAGVVSSKTGSGIRGFVGAAADADSALEVGTGVLGLSASGVKQVAGGATYVKTGSGALNFSAAALDISAFAESGTGIRGNVGSGVKQLSGGATYTQTGAGIRGHVGSGTDSAVLAETGLGALARSSSGTDTVSFAETGAGIRGHVGSGAKQALLGTTYQKSGSAILSFTGGGVRARTISRSSAGILDRSGRGVDVVSWGETGRGIITFTASGERSYGRIPGFVSIVNQVGIEVSISNGVGASVEVEDGRGSEVTVS